MKSLKSFIVLLAVSMLSFGCGGEEKKEDKKDNIRIQTKSDEAKPDENVANLSITGDDLMQYSTKELRVKEGQKVRLTLRHIGKMEKNVMGHNVVILKQGVDAAEFAARAATERDNDYIPPGSDQIIAYTQMIGGGQTTTIEFDAPAAGEYDFLCSFPAHFALMNGKFIVEPAAQ